MQASQLLASVLTMRAVTAQSNRVALFSVVNVSGSAHILTALGKVQKHSANPLFQVGGVQTPWLKDGIYSNIVFKQELHKGKPIPMLLQCCAAVSAKQDRLHARLRDWLGWLQLCRIS